MTVTYSTAVKNAKLDAITAQAGNAALLRIYDATGGKPANANASIGSCVKLAELVCGSPLAPAASGGVLTLNAIANDASADASGTAAFFRIYKADGTTVICQGDCGTSGSDLNLNTLSFTVGGPVADSSFTITAGN